MSFILGLEPVQRIRIDTTRDADNIEVRTDGDTIAFRASVQDVDGRQLQTLTEGDRQRDPKGLFTFVNIDLREGDQFSGVASDIIVYNGERYEIRDLHDWTVADPIPHIECLLLRVDEVT